MPALDRRAFVLTSLAGLAACARPRVDVIGVADPERPVDSVPGLHRHEIFLMTTRAFDKDPHRLFSGERGTLSLASMDVTIPPGHKPGEVEAPTRVPPDPAKDITILDPKLYTTDSSYVAAIDAALSRRAPKDRSVLVFVHGYNNTLTSAVQRIGQFVEDTGFTGVPVLFSWASGGNPLKYVYDLNSALAARDDLVHGAAILRRTTARIADVVAHSMGNLLVVEAMRQEKLANRYNQKGAIRNVILASPDIDVDLFARQISVFPKDDRHFFVLISHDDRALSISKLIAGNEARVGNADVDRLADLGVTVIDLSEIHDSGSSHTKFAGSPEIVQLIGETLSTTGPLDRSARPSLLADIALLPIKVVSDVGGAVAGPAP